MLLVVIYGFRLVYFGYIVEPKWHSNNLTYSFANEKDCDIWESYRIRRAFQEVQYETSDTLRFMEINGTSDIGVLCANNTYVPGNIEELENCAPSVGGETRFELLGGKIIFAEIVIYDYYNEGQKCLSATTEKHEILHALGFKHAGRTGSIMSPSLHYYKGDCLEDKNIDGKIVGEIERRYG